MDAPWVLTAHGKLFDSRTDIRSADCMLPRHSLVCSFAFIRSLECLPCNLLMVN